MKTMLAAVLGIITLGLWMAPAVPGETDVAPISRPLLKFATQPGKPIVVTAGSKLSPAIHYGPELDPTRFEAKLNGKDVTKYLHPKAGTSEQMRLPFKTGKNHLEFNVWRIPRRDLPPGMLSRNELHRLEVIVRPPTPAQTFVGRGRAIPPTKRNEGG